MNCPHIISSGTCPDGPSCLHNHTILSCEPCSFVAPSPETYEQHLKSKRHRSRTAPGRQPAQTFHCTICNRNTPSVFWNQHIGSRKHTSNAREQGVDSNVAPVEGVTTEKEVYCALCQHAFPSEVWPRHLEGTFHRRKEAFVKYRSVLDEAEKDKNGITVDGITNLGFLDPATMGPTWKGHSSTFVAKSNDPVAAIALIQAELASTQGGRRIHSG